MDDRKHIESIDHSKRKSLKRAMLQVPVIMTFKVAQLQAQASQPASWTGGTPGAPK